QTGPELVAKEVQPARFCLHLLDAQLDRLGETDDSGHIERAGAEAALVAPAVDLRGHVYRRRAAAHVEPSDALRAVDLMCRERREIDAEALQVERNLTDRLRGVRVEEDSPLAAEP